MTWVLGSGVIVGYAALISDIRVSWPDGTHHDILQKIHPVGSQLMCGFAGSVRLGFAMVEDLRHALKIPEGHVWYPRIAAWRWWRRGRRIYSEASTELRRHGCSLILAGVSAIPDAMMGNVSHVIVMRSPEFAPTFVRRGHWVSVGTGADHEYARSLAAQQQSDLMELTVTLGQGEVAIGRGGLAKMLTGSVGRALFDSPLHTVSESVQYGLVFADRMEIAAVRSTFSVGTPQQRTVGGEPVATSWLEFCRLCRDRNVEAAAAVT